MYQIQLPSSPPQSTQLPQTTRNSPFPSHSVTTSTTPPKPWVKETAATHTLREIIKNRNFELLSCVFSDISGHVDFPQNPKDFDYLQYSENAPYFLGRLFIRFKDDCFSPEDRYINRQGKILDIVSCEKQYHDKLINILIENIQDRNDSIRCNALILLQKRINAGKLTKDNLPNLETLVDNLIANFTYDYKGKPVEKGVNLILALIDKKIIETNSPFLSRIIIAAASPKVYNHSEWNVHSNAAYLLRLFIHKEIITPNSPQLHLLVSQLLGLYSKLENYNRKQSIAGLFENLLNQNVLNSTTLPSYPDSEIFIPLFKSWVCRGYKECAVKVLDLFPSDSDFYSQAIPILIKNLLGRTDSDRAAAASILINRIEKDKILLFTNTKNFVTLVKNLTANLSYDYDVEPRRLAIQLLQLLIDKGYLTLDSEAFTLVLKGATSSAVLGQRNPTVAFDVQEFLRNLIKHDKLSPQHFTTLVEGLLDFLNKTKETEHFHARRHSAMVFIAELLQVGTKLSLPTNFDETIKSFLTDELSKDEVQKILDLAKSF